MMSGKVRGRGMAASWYGIARTATIDRAGAWAELDDGGTAKVVTGVTEIGEGILTVLAQIAAEELGIQPEQVTIGDNDTARSPEAAHAGATRQTYMIGNAVVLACRDARARLVAELADVWDVPEDTIEAFDGEIWAEGTNLKMTMEEAVDLCKKRGVVPVGSGSFRAINPRGVEGQIEGGIVQGLGQALMEDYKIENGHTTTHGFAKYILPTSLDVPQINSIIVEDPDPLSPLGAKGIGEPALVPTAPAIMNAIYDAIGVRITSLPATPEKIRAGLAEKRQRDNVLGEAAE
jgi:CO/xanthine dehydrogenase Mo-binding subunit